MSHDAFESERFRVERVLEILEQAARRLDDGTQVPMTVLKDAVKFMRAAEEVAYEAALVDDSEPTSSACLEQIAEGRRLLTGMQEEIRMLELGDAAAAARFARLARHYVERRREHLRLDDRLFAMATTQRRARDESVEPGESVETPGTRRLYDRLLEASAILDIGVSTVFPIARARRVRTT